MSLITVRQQRRFVPPRGQRGVALLIIMFVSLALLVGGLASVAVSSGELGAAGGFRAKYSYEQCSTAGLERIRAMMPDVATFDATEGTLSSAFTYRAGHYDGDTSNDSAEPFRVIDPSSYDAMALLGNGQVNITNYLGPRSGGALGEQYDMVTTTTVCNPSDPKGEMQFIFRYGIPVAN